MALTADYLEGEHEGFRVETATSATEGLATLDRTWIDCIVSDYEMPETTGIELLESVRSDHPDLPVIIFTGRGTESVASRAISAGVTDYLHKDGGPEQFTILANRIENAVDKYRTEQRLTETRRRYEQVTEQNLAGIYLIQNGEFVFVNPTLAEIHGYERETVVGMSPLELVAPAERDRVQRQLRRRLDGDVEDIHYETVGLTKTGEHIDIELHGSRTTYDGSPAIIGTELDITERKERQRELQRTKQRLEMALQEARAGLWKWDLDTDDLYWSDELLDLLGLSPDEFDGDIGAFEERLHPDDVDRVEAAIETAIENETHYQVEERIEDADGEYIWLDARGRVAENGDSRSMTGIVIDITERKEQEELLRRQRDRLDELTRTLSHDLRNPLQVADGQLKLARRECDSEHLETVDLALDRIDTLITDVLSLTENGETAADSSLVDLAALAQNCWRTVDTAEATLVTDIDRTLRAHESRLRQLFENLIRNAVEHAGTHVTVTVGELPGGFYVEDDGPGIPAEERGGVFEVGYSTSEDGTGFGLNIVKRVVETHGWDVQVTEGTDGGARFEVTGVESATE
nr:PAS domain S-box protein [Halomicroarcula sp. DFY41]